MSEHSSWFRFALVGVFIVVATVATVDYAHHARPSASPAARLELTAAELRDLNEPGISLNAGDYLSLAAEAAELTAAEREMLDGLRGRRVWGELIGPRVFPLNRDVLAARVVTFTLPSGRVLRFVGAPVAKFRNEAWTGRSIDRGGLVLDNTSQGFVGNMCHQRVSYYMQTMARGSRYMVVSPVPPGEFHEPPDMSGHPPYPDGVMC